VTNMKKLGLALGGGGLRGLAHIGILQVLEDNNIPLNVVAGTSVGSIIAALYASGMSAYQMEQEVVKLKPYDYLDYNISGFIKHFLACFFPPINNNIDGIIKGERLEKIVYRLTGGRDLRDSKVPLAIIACDIDSGREIIFASQKIPVQGNDILLIEDARLSQAVRASTAIPAVFVPYRLQGMQLVDGGVRSMVPVMVQRLLGAEYILAINLGQEVYDQAVEGIPQIVNRTISILAYETSATEQKVYANMVIHPQVGEVKLHDLHRAPEIVRIGRRVMKERIDELKKALLAQ
jgi:NTE family protein